MSKGPAAPYDLSQTNPKLRKLLDERDAMLKAIGGPLRAAQQVLARFRDTTPGAASDAAAPVAARDLPAVTVEFTQRLTAVEELDRELLAIRTAKSDPAGPAALNQLIAQHAAVVQLQQAKLNPTNLEKYAPNPFRDLEAVDEELDDAEKEQRKLKGELKSWWTRVMGDFFLEILQKPTRKEQLAETEKEIDKLTRKRKKAEDGVRQAAAAVLGGHAKQAAALVEKKRAELIAADKHLDERAAKAWAAREKALVDARRSADRLRRAHKAYCDGAVEQLNGNAAEVADYLGQLPTAATRGWDADAWDEWPPAGDSDGDKRVLEPVLSDHLRLGEMHEETDDRLAKAVDGDALRLMKGRVKGVTVPVVVPFIGKGRTLVVSCDGRSRDDGLDVVQSFVLRAAALLGRQVKFTLLDPSGHGQAFPVQRFLQARATADDVNADLKAVQQDIRRVNQNVLAGEEGLHKLDARRLASEQFELVVAAGFPDGYDRRAVETLYNLGGAGPRAGRYVVLHHDRSETLPKELPIDGVPNAFTIDPRSPFTPPPDFLFMLDQPPPVPRQQELLERMKEAGKVDHSLDWEGVMGLKPSEWWTGSSVEEISTAMGMRGGTDRAGFWFGERSTGFSAHGVLAGMTGSGKSTLYHSLIMGLAARYSPDELRMYLIDLKQGVEFLTYKELPHAAVVSLNTPPELTLSILRELETEMVRRNEAFKAVGAKDFTVYRQQGHKLPRVLLLIDEYQRLFADDIAEPASAILARLASQARSTGIHMFIGSQGFGAPGMMNQSAVFNQFNLKVAMKLNPAAVAGLTEFGPVGKRLIRDITLPGRFVMNDSGKDDQTIDAQAPYLKEEKRDELIQKLRVRAGKGVKPPQVFDGEAPSDVLDNTALNGVLDQRAALTPKALEGLARKDEGPDGGFGQPRWVAGDRPLGLWLGRRFNVHGHAMAMLPRNVQQNLLIVGGSAEARGGMLTGLLTSLATLYRPTEVAVDVIHAAGDDDDPSLLACQAVIDRLLRPAGHAATFTRESSQAEPMLAQYDAELTARKEHGAKDAPSRLLVLLEPDRMPALRGATGIGAKPTPNQEWLRRLLTEGSQSGLHVALVVSAFSLVNLVADKRKDLPAFAHRVGLQMSQNDSYDLFGHFKAASLQAEGGKVAVALYTNTETNENVRFKPYSVPKADALNAFDRLARTLAKAFAAPTGG